MVTKGNCSYYHFVPQIRLKQGARNIKGTIITTDWVDIPFTSDEVPTIETIPHHVHLDYMSAKTIEHYFLLSIYPSLYPSDVETRLVRYRFSYDYNNEQQGEFDSKIEDSFKEAHKGVKS